MVVVAVVVMVMVVFGFVVRGRLGGRRVGVGDDGGVAVGVLDRYVDLLGLALALARLFCPRGGCGLAAGLCWWTAAGRVRQGPGLSGGNRHGGGGEREPMGCMDPRREWTYRA